VVGSGCWLGVRVCMRARVWRQIDDERRCFTLNHGGDHDDDAKDEELFEDDGDEDDEVLIAKSHVFPSSARATFSFSWRFFSHMDHSTSACSLTFDNC